MYKFCYKKIIGSLIFYSALNVYGAMLQQPVLATSASIPPNMVFNIDDSGSMAFECLPDSLCTSSSVRVGSVPEGMGTYKSAVATYDWRYYTNGSCIRYNSQWPYQCAEYRLIENRRIFPIKMRSSAANPLYYNPEKTYQPWLNYNGQRMPEYSVSSAPVYPEYVNQTGRQTSYINLLQTSSWINNSWCRSLNDCSNANLRDLNIAQYFKFNGNLNSAADLNDPFKYEQVIITDPDELQNFSNWYSYHRDRMRVAKAGSAEAFYSVPAEYRVGRARIGNSYGAGSVDGISAPAMVSGVRSFYGAEKENFYKWLLVDVQPTPNGTPLRKAMNDVGKYYSDTSNRGPWGKNPGTNDSSPHLSCRRAFHILMTDGLWNDSSPPNVGNSDNVNGPVIQRHDANGNLLNPRQQYQYVPASPYQDRASNTLADVAMEYWKKDLNPNLNNTIKPSVTNPAFWQHMVNYTIAFGVSGNLRPEVHGNAIATNSLNTWPSSIPAESLSTIDDLWHAAINSRGEFLSAGDADEYAKSLRFILNDIQSISGSESGVGLTSRVISMGAGYVNKKFEAEFDSEEWSGDLKAFSLNSLGGADELLWSAETKMPLHGARKIYFYDSSRSASQGYGSEFLWNALSNQNKEKLTSDFANGANLVNYLRGDRVNEGVVYRKRGSVLGDIVNSTPIWVKDQFDGQYSFLYSGHPGRGSYYRFLEAKKRRVGHVFAGANDGMLHAFNENTGVEAFAFVPDQVFDKVVKLANPLYSHEYFVDGPLIESDIYDAQRSKWLNMVYGTAGAGAKSIFAINVPVPEYALSGPISVNELNASSSAPKGESVLWNISNETYDANSHYARGLGYVLSKPEAGIMPDGRWALIFGNGYESSDKRAKLFVVDALNGSVLKVLDTGVGSESQPNGLGGVRLLKDQQQRIVAAYAGDLAGNLWKFDFSNSNPSSWSVAFGGRPLYTVPSGEGPIIATPTYVNHPAGGVMLAFGTGKAFEVGDTLDTSLKALYGVWDKVKIGSASTDPSGAIAGQSQIVNQSLSRAMTGLFFNLNVTQPDYTIHRGWRLPLTILSGQRMVDAPELTGGLIFFQTLSPSDATDSCTSGSIVRHALIIDPFMSAIDRARFDTNGDGIFSSADNMYGAATELSGSGPATVIRERGTNNFRVIQSRTSMKDSPIFQGLPGNVKRSWRQLMKAGN